MSFKINSNGKLKVDIEVEDLWKLIQKTSRDIDNIDISMDEISKVLNVCSYHAKTNPDRYREARHDIISRHVTEGYEDHPLYYIYKKYGYRSVIMGTAAKMVSMTKLTREEMNRKLVGYIPPAFDVGLMYGKSVKKEHNAFKLLDKWREIPLLRDMIFHLRDTRKKYLEKYSNEKRIMLLNNGSSQSWCSGTVNITDVMSNIYCYQPLSDPYLDCEMSFSHLKDLVGLRNSRDDNDPFAYIEVTDQWKDHGFKVIAIPDKDGKVRIIFLGRADVQTLSKCLHEMWDLTARVMPGNYTYNHKDWIKNIIDKGWNKDKYILGTDISKFSDTFMRTYLLKILEKAGYTQDELREIDMLYSLPVENLDGTILSNTLASYQGQYGDFPLITIGNLSLQYMVYYVLNMKYFPGCNGAVGDDTGFVFDYFRQDIENTIIEIYGSTGMKINKLKTGSIYQDRTTGKQTGVVDFVKLRFDSEGILPFIEPKPYYEKDFDQAIRDIYDSIFFSDDYKRQLFELLFSTQAAESLMNKSIINGGISKRVIEVADVEELLTNRIRLTALDSLKFGSFYTWMNQATKELNESGFGWKDTVFSETREAKERLKELSDAVNNFEITQEEAEQMFEVYVGLIAAKVHQVGSKYGSKDYRKLIGKDPVAIYENHKKRQNLERYDEELEEYYLIIKDNDNWLGRYKKRAKNIQKSAYKNKILDDVNGVDEDYVIRITDDYKSILVEPENDFKGSIKEIIDYVNSSRVISYALSKSILVVRHNGAGTHYYVKWNGQQYALFDDKKSVYPLVTQDVIDDIPMFNGWSREEIIEKYNHHCEIE